MLSEEKAMKEVNAGFTSMLDPSTSFVDDTYYEALDSQTEQGLSPVTEGYRTAVQEEKNAVLDENLSDIVANPGIADATKEVLIKGGHRTVTRDPVPLQVINDATKTEMYTDTQETRFQRATLQQQKNKIYKYLSYKKGIEDGTRLNESPTLSTNLANLGLMFTPYVEQLGLAKTLHAQGDNKEAALSLILMGEGKKHLKTVLSNMPIDERMTAIDSIVNVIEEGNSLNGVSHDRAIREQLRIALMDEDYSNFDRLFDDLISVADATGAGALLGALGKGLVKGMRGALKLGKDVDNVERAVKMSQVKSATTELSPKVVADTTNDDLGTAMANSIVQDTTDETAKALTGTTRNEAIADLATPEIMTPEGLIKNKPIFDSVPAEVEGAVSRLQEQLADSTIGAYSQKEVEALAAVKFNNLASVTGVTTRKEMSSFEALPEGSTFHMVYGPNKGGYASPENAMESVQKALSDYGVKPEDMSLLVREESGSYKKADIDNLEPYGDYLVKVEYKQDFKPSEVTAWEKYDVNFGFLGKSARYVLDPASLFRRELAGVASAKVDKAAAINKDLLSVGEEFVTMSKNIGPQREARVWDYLKEANEKGLKLDERDLFARGFTQEEASGIKSFRRFWDMHWFIKNNNDVKLLAEDGYRVIATPKARIWGKPSKGMEPSEHVLDVDSGALRVLSSPNDVKLAEEQGSLVKMMVPQEIDGRVVNYAFSSSKHRAPNPDSDFLTPYREGYYTRNYEAPYFVIQRVTDSFGKTYDRAIATANSTKDAELYMKSLRLKDPSIKEEDLFKRSNVENPGENLLLQTQINHTYGRGSNRARGEKLEDASAVVDGLEDSHLLDPEAAMFRSAASVSTQASMGEFIRAAEKRLLKTYNDVMPRDAQGRAVYPASSDQIGGKGFTLSPEATDAKVMFEYIESLKNGYADVLDNATKATMYRLAEVFGRMSVKTSNEILSNLFDKTERALIGIGSKASPVGLSKSLAFNTYIAMNPLRQFVLNTSQVLQLTALNPKFMADPRAAMQASAMWMKELGVKIPEHVVKASGRSRSELELMHNEYLKSGLSASISQHNLRRSSLTDMAREAEWSRKTAHGMGKATDIAATPLTLMRKIGFENGEAVNLMVTWLAHYDLVRGTKPALNKSDFLKIGADTRNFTYNMNRAGDMKYNSSALSAALQFAQVPHKALMTALTNRGIDKATKAKLLVINGLMFGLPASFVGYTSMAVEDILGKDPDPELAQTIHNGLLAVTFNTLMDQAFEGTTDVSFKNISPMDASGVYKTVDALLENNLIDAFKDGAGWSAWGSVGEVATTLTKVLGGEKWADGSDAGLKDLALSVLDLSSGASNILRAKLALEYGKLYGRSGNERDVSVNTPTAFMAAAGFQTTDEVTKWAMRDGTKAFKNQRRKDIDSMLNRTYYELAKANYSGDPQQFRIKALAHIFSTMDLTPTERSYVASKLRQRVGGDSDLVGEALKLFKVYGGAEEADKIMLLRADKDQYERWRKSRETIENLNKDLRSE